MPGEKHLVLPRQVYHHFGPKSDLLKRLDPKTDLPYHDPHLSQINQVDYETMIHDKDYRDAEKLESPDLVLKAKHVGYEKLVRNLKSIRVSGWRESLAKLMALKAIKMKLNFRMSISKKLIDNQIQYLDDFCNFHNMTEDNTLFQQLFQNSQPNNLKGLVQKSL